MAVDSPLFYIGSWGNPHHGVAEQVRLPPGACDEQVDDPGIPETDWFIRCTASRIKDGAKTTWTERLEEVSVSLRQSLVGLGNQVVEFKVDCPTTFRCHLFHNCKQAVWRCHEVVDMKGVTFNLSQVIQGRNDGISDRVPLSAFPGKSISPILEWQ